MGQHHLSNSGDRWPDNRTHDDANGSDQRDVQAPIVRPYIPKPDREGTEVVRAVGRAPIPVGYPVQLRLMGNKEAVVWWLAQLAEIAELSEVSEFAPARRGGVRVYANMLRRYPIRGER